MKTSSLKILFVLSTFIVLYTGCNMPDKNKNKDAGYQQALKLEKTGNFYWHENESDSALKCYYKCIALYKTLKNKSGSSSDTIYINRISVIYDHIGNIYVTKHNLDSVLYYALQSLKLGYQAHEGLNDIQISNYNVASVYKEMGDEKGKGSEKCKTFYRKGIPYALSACWEIDSLGVKSNSTLSNYYLAMDMFGVIGDTIREKFYHDKYHELHNYLQGQKPVTH